MTPEALTPSAAATRIAFPGVGGLGIFDASLEAEGEAGPIWMSYTAIEPSPRWPRNAHLNIRLAHSDDGGRSFRDDGIVNQALDVTLPATAPKNAGTWIHEVSRVVHDPFASAAERWVLFWHRYLVVDGDFRAAINRGWIGVRTASAPQRAAWSAERKLFVGWAYDRVDDALLGPPEVPLHTLHPELATCAVPTEPGALARPEALYVSLYCAAADTADGRLVLIRRPRDRERWEYVGTLADNRRDAHGMGFDNFSATEIERVGARTLLIVSPERAGVYLGCLVFEIETLASATLMRRAGLPSVVASIPEKPGGFRGACGYEARSQSGIVYGEVLDQDPPRQLFMSFFRP